MKIFKESPKIERAEKLAGSLRPKNKNLAIGQENWTKESLNFPWKSYFTRFPYLLWRIEDHLVGFLLKTNKTKNI